jgi:NitT/TauT family transport system permease protein
MGYGVAAFTRFASEGWQAIGSWTKGVAVSPPLQTLVYLFDLLQTWMLGSCSRDTGCVPAGLRALGADRPGPRPDLRGAALHRRGRGAHTRRLPYHPESHALSGRAVGLRPRHVCQGCLRCHARTGADDPFHPRRGTQFVTRIDPDGQGAAAFTCAHDALGVGAGLPARYRQRSAISFSLSLLGVLIGEMFSSQRGLGFLLVNGMAQHNVPLSTAVVTVIVLIAIAANTLMLRLGKRTAHRSN